MLQGIIKRIFKKTKEKTKVVDALIRTYIDKGWLDEAEEAIELGASRDAIDLLIRAYIQKGGWWLYRARGLIKRLKASKGVIDFLVKTYLDNDRLSEAIEAVKEFGASQEIINSLTGAHISIGRLYEAIEAAKLGASKKVVEFLVKICIQRKQVFLAKKAARLIGRSLTIQEIRELL